MMEYPKKNPQSKARNNNNLTLHTCRASDWNETLMGGKRSHQCTIPASLTHFKTYLFTLHSSLGHISNGIKVCDEI